jgi:hypothetical protein
MWGSAVRALLLAALVFALAWRAARADAPPGAGSPSLELAVAAGAGYDSNVVGSSGATPALATGYATARAVAGTTLELSRDDELSLDLAYDGIVHRPRYQDLSQHRGALVLSWAHLLGERLALRLSATGGVRTGGDPARGGWDAAAAAAARLRLHPRLAVRLATAVARRYARDDAYASDDLRVRAAVELDLWWRSWLSLAWSSSLGQDTFYAPAAPSPSAPVAAGGSGPGGAGPRAGEPGDAPGGAQAPAFGGALVAYRDERVAHALSADLVQPLPGGLFLAAGYSFSTVRGAVESYDAHALTAEVGWRR